MGTVLKERKKEENLMEVLSQDNNNIQNIQSSLALLNSQILATKDQVFEVINKNYEEFSYVFHSSQSLNDEVEKFVGTLEAISNEVEDPENGLKAKLTNQSKEISSIKTQLNQTNQTISILQSLCGLHTHLQQFDEFMTAGEYQRAALSIQQMNSLFKNLSMHKGSSETTIVKLIKSEFTKKKSSLRHELEDCFGRAIIIENKPSISKSTVKISSKLIGTKSISLVSIFEAFDTLGLVVPKMETLSRQFTEHIIKPLISNPNMIISIQNSQFSSEFVCSIDLSLKRESSQLTMLSSISSGELFEKILTFMEFLSQNFYPYRHSNEKENDGNNSMEVEKSDYCQILGAAWWKDLSSILIKECLQQTIPSESHLLETYSSFSEKVLDFQNELIATGIVPSQSRELGDFVQNIEIHYAEKKRTDLLVIAREILMSDDHNTVEITDATERGALIPQSEEKTKNVTSEKVGKEGFEQKEGLISLKNCHISVKTQTLMELVYQTLDDASKSTPKIAAELYLSCRDMLDLFRAIVPIYHSISLEQIPAIAMLFFNDCTYISHHLLTLGFQYQEKIPPNATFIDMVPLFRKLGEKYFKLQMKKRKSALLENISEANGFGETNEDSRFEIVEKVIRQVLLSLSQLSKVWKPILSSDVYLFTMGNLINDTLNAFILEVESLKDISEVETHQLHHLLSLPLNQIPLLFVIGKEKTQIPVSKHVKSWEKFRKITELLEASLADIIQRSENGNLFEFSNQELSSLVQALFSESTKRDSFLETLK